MLYELAQYLVPFESNFSFFLYLTVRGVMAAATAFVLSMLLCWVMIGFAHRRGMYPGMREKGPAHSEKSGTPILGGVAMVISIAVSVLLWADLDNVYIWLALAAMLLYAFIGGADDYLKVARRDSAGLRAGAKLVVQTLAAALLAFAAYRLAQTGAQTDLLIPYMKSTSFDMGWWFVPFSILVIVGCSNSVNLMDGLDGLCILPVVMIASALAVFAYVSGNIVFSSYLNIPYIPGNGELAVVAVATAGAGMGFLWFNAHPAEIFMGDTGSLALGALLAVLAILVRQELVLAIMAGLFVVQACSVILQVGSFKLRGRRIFKMAPLHHHFELSGWTETKIIIRFSIITFLLVMLGLASLKIR